MRVIREVKGFKLVFDPLQRMYRLTNKDYSLLSYWFNSNDVDDILCLSDSLFIHYCRSQCV